MNDYRFTISLGISHPSMDPARITDAFGLIPSRSWRSGEPRTTPKGTPLKGKWPHSYWTAHISKGQSANKPLAKAIHEALEQLASHKDFLHQIRSEGGRAEFFIGWFFDGNSGDVFGHDLLARAADLKIDLSLDVYPAVFPTNQLGIARSN